jgi:hypothetical protein
MADHATLGHYLPYLLGRRLRAVVWPADGGQRAVAVLLLSLLALYGAGFGFLLNHQHKAGLAKALPTIIVGLNATWLASTLLVDFMPTLRPVTRPMPEHFPVSERQNVVTAFLLDFITLRRLILVLGLLVALAVAPRHALVPGFSLLLLLGATALSFNVRLLAALGRWRHPLLAANLLSLGLMGWWLAVPAAPYAPALGVGMALLPWLVGAAQLYRPPPPPRPPAPRWPACRWSGRCTCAGRAGLSSTGWCSRWRFSSSAAPSWSPRTRMLIPASSSFPSCRSSGFRMSTATSSAT